MTFLLLSVVCALAEPPAIEVAANVAYVQAETPSKRFPDAEADGPVFTPGARVDVLVAEGPRVRVVAGDKFGWIPAAALGATPPAPDLGGYTLPQ